VLDDTKIRPVRTASLDNRMSRGDVNKGNLYPIGQNNERDDKIYVDTDTYKSFLRDLGDQSESEDIDSDEKCSNFSSSSLGDFLNEDPVLNNRIPHLFKGCQTDVDFTLLMIDSFASRIRFPQKK
jgi:hypothetical protein